MLPSDDSDRVTTLTGLNHAGAPAADNIDSDVNENSADGDADVDGETSTWASGESSSDAANTKTFVNRSGVVRGLSSARAAKRARELLTQAYTRDVTKKRRVCQTDSVGGVQVDRGVVEIVDASPKNTKLISAHDVTTSSAEEDAFNIRLAEVNDNFSSLEGFTKLPGMHLFCVCDQSSPGRLLLIL